MPYIGRFAPTPTGPLHFGSLIAALASYLDAKANEGQWLVRIDDIDPPREVKGAADQILSTLEAFGLLWDQQVTYQSHNNQRYDQVIESLQDQSFFCTCTRKQLGQGLYPGNCYHKKNPQQPFAVRFKVPNGVVTFDDRIQGHQTIDQKQLGDFVIKRKEGLFAYHLAVVADDFAQNISHIVRGYDLKDLSFFHILLQKSLGYSTPSYGHFPVAAKENGQKLSKQNLAPAIKPEQSYKLTLDALNFLNQPLPTETLNQKELLDWAVNQWDINLIKKTGSIVLPNQ